MADSTYLDALIAERDALIAVMTASVGKTVRSITIRGREVEYADALKHREYLDREIRRCSGTAGPARNKVRLGRV